MRLYITTVTLHDLTDIWRGDGVYFCIFFWKLMGSDYSKCITQNRPISLLCNISDRTSIFPLQTNNHCPANDACLEHQTLEQVALKQRSEMFDLFSPMMVCFIWWSALWLFSNQHLMPFSFSENVAGMHCMLCWMKLVKSLVCLGGQERMNSCWGADNRAQKPMFNLSWTVIRWAIQHWIWMCASKFCWVYLRAWCH